MRCSRSRKRRRYSNKGLRTHSSRTIIKIRLVERVNRRSRLSRNSWLEWGPRLTVLSRRIVILRTKTKTCATKSKNFEMLKIRIWPPRDRKATLVSLMMKIMTTRMILRATSATVSTTTASATALLVQTLFRIENRFLRPDRSPLVVLVPNQESVAASSRGPPSRTISQIKKQIIRSNKIGRLLIGVIIGMKRRFLRIVPRDSSHLRTRGHLAPTTLWTQTARNSKTSKTKLTAKCRTSALDLTTWAI